jgi:hypothetical protein
LSKITQEIDQLFEEICGTPITNPKLEREVEKQNEKLEKMKLDVLYFFKEAYGMGLPEYQKEFIKSLEDEVMYRSSMAHHKFRCKCGEVYEIISKEDYRLRTDWSPWNGDRPGVDMVTEMWHCFRCGTPITTIGRLVKIRNDRFEHRSEIDRKFVPAPYEQYKRGFNHAMMEREIERRRRDRKW